MVILKILTELEGFSVSMLGEVAERKIDEALKAPLAKTPEQWLAQPNRFDTPKVDTLKQRGK